MLRKVSILIACALALAGCSLQAPAQWTAGTGPIKIVTSTDVWGSVANLVAGKFATVTALVSNANQDPHSFEASARDQLLVDNADIVVMNGGGYDDFMQRMVDADPTPAVTVDAFMVAGFDEKRNEHIWYDVDQVGDVAAVIAAAIETLRPEDSDSLDASVADFRRKLAERKALLEAIKASGACGRVFATEPLVDYLLEDAGCQNVTPAAYSRAIEEERDVPPAVMLESMKIVKGNLYFVATNSQVSTGQISELLRLTTRKTLSFSELLGASDYWRMLDEAIAKVGNSK